MSAPGLAIGTGDAITHAVKADATMIDWQCISVILRGIVLLSVWFCWESKTDI